MGRQEASLLYANLRRTYLSAAAHHRRAAAHPALLPDAHRIALANCQRQLGALRQAYRRTREAIAWRQYRGEHHA